jgi:hypothetical protein
MNRKRSISIGVLLALLTAILGLQAAAVTAKSGDSSPEILKWQTMVGVQGAFVGATNPIRNVPGGGIAWALASGHGSLTADGHIQVKVEGLVLAGGANAGSNPIGTFRAIVSCLASDGTVQNVQTDPFTATTGPASAGGGNAKIEADLVLPDPCIAPIVFVTSPTGSWFASTGG